MIETVHLAAHEPIPQGPTPEIVVLRRFQEHNAHHALIQIILVGPRSEITTPHRPDGTLMDLSEAIVAARAVAREEGLTRILVIDRLLGPREADVARHDGDRSIKMDRLVDNDPDATGSDMRDIVHPAPRP